MCSSDLGAVLLLDGLPGLRGALQALHALCGFFLLLPAPGRQRGGETVEATIHQHGDGSRLEVVLVNPGGQEATDRERARVVGAVAQEAYGRTLDTVRVSFEYSSQAGPAEVGFHRRYAFAPGALDTVAPSADTGAAMPDTAAADPDTMATPQP